MNVIKIFKSRYQLKPNSHFTSYVHYTLHAHCTCIPYISCVYKIMVPTTEIKNSNCIVSNHLVLGLEVNFDTHQQAVGLVMSQGVVIGMDQKVGLGMEVAIHIDLQKVAMEMSGIDQREVLGLHLNLDHMVQTHLLGLKGIGLVGVVQQRPEVVCCRV